VSVSEIVPVILACSGTAPSVTARSPDPVTVPFSAGMPATTGEFCTVKSIWIVSSGSRPSVGSAENVIVPTIAESGTPFWFVSNTMEKS
jgi:hypothetical protein